MEQQYVWNIAEVVKNNPLPDDRKLTRTFLVDGKYCTALVVQAQPQEEPFIHIHKEHDEFLYVLEGKGWAYIGDKKLEVKAGDLYELIDQRYRCGSMIVTANRSPEDWYSLFPNPVIAESALHRLLSCAHIITLTSKSYRSLLRPDNALEKEVVTV